MMHARKKDAFLFLKNRHGAVLPRYAVFMLFFYILSPLCSHANGLSASSTLPWYQIELLFFSQPQAVREARIAFMHLPLMGSQRITRYLKPYSRHTTPRNAQAFQALPSRFFKLDAMARRLRHAPGYRVMGHTAWAQPVMRATLAASPTLLLPYGRAFYPDGERVQHPSVQAAMREANWQWDHLLRVRVQRSHFFTVSMIAQHRGAEAKIGEDQRMLIDFKQTRRMRSQQLNYFDHPRWGVLVMITPITNHVNINDSNRSL